MRAATLAAVLALSLATAAEAGGCGPLGVRAPVFVGPGAGAAAGALLGRAVAGRRDNTLAIVGGSALGAAIGSSLAARPCLARRGSEPGAVVSDRPRALAEVERRRAAYAAARLEHAALEREHAALAPPAADDTVAAQRLLLALGYDPGPVDGIAGPATRDAIRRFEAAQGLPPTGRLTPALLARLRAAL